MKAPKQIRWNVETASREFGINPRTLAKNLANSDAPPGEDGMFSTRQICSAVFSDYEQERTRLTRAQADQAELDLAKSRNEVLPTDVSFQACSNVLYAVRRVIETSALMPSEKDDIYREIQAFKPEKLVEEKEFEEGENQ